MKRPTLHHVFDLTVFYPTPSLFERISAWAGENGRYVEFASERGLPEIRQRIRDASFVVIGDGEDCSLAADAFLQASRSLGAENVIVHVEKTSDDFEILVRSCGSPYYLGPMDASEWNAALDCKFPRTIPFGVDSRRRAA